MTEPMAGSLIAGRYRLDGKIGDGGVAVVYKGLDITLEREVAVKILRPELADSAEIVGRFRREAHSAAKLNHPNVVQIYDTGVDDGTYYIVMEYLPEPDLKRIIKEYAPLPLRKVLEVSIQCARALAYAHKQGLVHRDVKPHNILFTDDGRVKLSDFGIAAATGEGGLTDSGLVLGTAYYVSPEQAQGAPATVQSDIYSLGVVMFECVTGRPPFTGANPAEIAAKHVRERPPSLRSLNSNITPSAEFVINKAMAREISRRYRGADELLVDLEKLADGIELDRTGVLGPSSEDATMRLAPTPAPVAPPMAAPAAAPVARPASSPPPRSAAPMPSRAPERNPGNVAAFTALAVIIVVLALLGVGWLVKQAFYPGQPQRNTQVPSVKGMSLEEARKTLEDAGMVAGKVSYREGDSAPDGTVIEQIPNVDEVAEPGTAVALVVSRGAQTVTVPSLTGRTVAEATERLKQAGLQAGAVERVFHDSIPDGQIVKQAIAGGTRVETGTAVDLTVSKGAEPKPVEPVASEEDTQLAEDPQVEISQDEGYKPKNEGDRRYVVKISAMGTQRGQKVQVVKSDDSGRGVVVSNLTLDPGAAREVKVDVQGNAMIEVYHNDRAVFSEPYPMESISE
ncbi:MAG: Stk1 family PASTA domain-containing Ser/Thr kinase [Armatimonadota bacterium]